PRREPAFKYLSFRIRFSGEEPAEETLLSHTCHSESASAVRNLLFARVPILSRSLRNGGDFFQATRGGCPHPPGWGLFSRCRRESAFTHLSFRGAPRRERAFKYLSFRFRFSAW